MLKVPACLSVALSLLTIVRRLRSCARFRHDEELLQATIQREDGRCFLPLVVFRVGIRNKHHKCRGSLAADSYFVAHLLERNSYESSSTWRALCTLADGVANSKLKQSRWETREINTIYKSVDYYQAMSVYSACTCCLR